MTSRRLMGGGMALLVFGAAAWAQAQTVTPQPASEAMPESNKLPLVGGLFSSKEQMQAPDNAAQPQEVIPDIPNFIPSYGTIEPSVLFTDDMIRRMKEELDRVERLIAAGMINVSEEDATEAAQEAKPMEAISFPAYRVASIVYRSPSDWMVWLDGKRVTPKRNDGAVRVVAVGPDSVRLSWSPEDWDRRMLVWNEKQEPSAEIIKIRAQDAHTGIDEGHSAITATMRPNQTWVTAYPVVVEGSHPELSISLTPQSDQASLSEGGGGKDALDLIARKQAQQINANSQKLVSEEKPTLQSRKAQQKTDAALPGTPSAANAASLPPEAAPFQDRTPTSLNDVLNAIDKADSAAANKQ